MNNTPTNTQNTPDEDYFGFLGRVDALCLEKHATAALDMTGDEERADRILKDTFLNGQTVDVALKALEAEAMATVPVHLTAREVQLLLRLAMNNSVSQNPTARELESTDTKLMVASLRHRAPTVEQAYVDRTPDQCPNPDCENDDITGDSVEIDGDTAVQECHCSECDVAWINVYHLTRIENAEGFDPTKKL